MAEHRDGHGGPATTTQRQASTHLGNDHVSVATGRGTPATIRNIAAAKGPRQLLQR